MSDAFDFAKIIREGDCVAWSGAAAEPTGLLAQFSNALATLPRCTGFASLSLANALNKDDVAGRMRIRALGGAGTNRRFQDVGALDVLPVHYGALPDLVAAGTLHFDVILTSLAADGSAFNLGPQVDYIADAIPRATAVRDPRSAAASAIAVLHSRAITLARGWPARTLS